MNIYTCYQVIILILIMTQKNSFLLTLILFSIRLFYIFI